MDDYYYEKAQDRGLVLADFDLCNTTHLYSGKWKKCLCGRHKKHEPMAIYLPNGEWRKSLIGDSHICRSCERIMKKLAVD